MNRLQFSIDGPYNFQKSLRFSRDCLFESISGPDRMGLRRAVLLDGRPAVIEILVSDQIEKPEVDLKWEVLDDTNISSEAATGFARKVLMADCRLEEFYRLARRSKQLAPLVERQRGLKPILTSSIFEAATWAIVGQQVNLSFATSIKKRLVDKYGMKFHLNGSSFSLFPTTEKLSRLRIDSLMRLQLSQRKAEYLTGLAALVSKKELPLEELSREPYEDALQQLLSVRGIGPWSANYTLMRGAGHLDALPVGDSGLHRAAVNIFSLRKNPDSARMTRLAAPFRPFRSLFTLYLWYSLLSEDRNDR